MKLTHLWKSFSTLRTTNRCISTDIYKSELTHNLKKQIEEYWSKQYNFENQFNERNLKDKCYILSMFPYPSGNLHIGHVRVYTISDVMARFHRMDDKNVLQPMGWDAFGLPAENAAVDHGIAPSKWTEENISHMKKQLDGLLCTFDWNCELSTCDPNYYRWTQFLFLKLFESGLAYQREAVVKWDPVDGTVLANEQVDEKGRSWRSGAKVERKLLKQWFIRTTKFSKNLYDALDGEHLDNWTEIMALQKNWIGVCDGFAFDFQLTGTCVGTEDKFLNIWVKDPVSVLHIEFILVQSTNNVYMLYGHTQNSDGKLDVEVINPFTKNKISIYVVEEGPYPSNRDVYVGTPSKNEFDRQFSEKVKLNPISNECLVSYDREKICAVAQEWSIGGYPVSSKLRDWLISRQRYWGTPIPIIHCDGCGAQPVPYNQLPVVLPTLPENEKIGKSLNNFLKTAGWVNAKCPKCGGAALRETDTMDTFVDSSWYYLRYIDPNNEKEPFNVEVTNQVMPVDIYVGGQEHAVLHLYYARFMHHFLHSIGLAKHEEPFRNLLCQGMVKGRTYKTKAGKYLKPDEVLIKGKNVISKETGEQLVTIFEKMSKSKFNGVEPLEVLHKYGVDSIRFFLLHHFSPRHDFEWNEKDLDNTLKWQYRIWATVQEFVIVRDNVLTGLQPKIDINEKDIYFRSLRNHSVAAVTYHYERSQNIAAALEFIKQLIRPLRNKFGATREYRKYSKEYERNLAAMIIMISPVMPHFAATLWLCFTRAPGRLNCECDDINWDANVWEQKWPQIDDKCLVPLIFQVKSGPYYQISIANSEIENLTLQEALKYGGSHEEVDKWLQLNSVQTKLVKYKNCLAEVTIIVPNRERVSLMRSLKKEMKESK